MGDRATLVEQRLLVGEAEQMRKGVRRRIRAAPLDEPAGEDGALGLRQARVDAVRHRNNVRGGSCVGAQPPGGLNRTRQRIASRDPRPFPPVKCRNASRACADTSCAAGGVLSEPEIVNAITSFSQLPSGRTPDASSLPSPSRYSMNRCTCRVDRTPLHCQGRRAVSGRPRSAGGGVGENPVDPMRCPSMLSQSRPRRSRGLEFDPVGAASAGDAATAGPGRMVSAPSRAMNRSCPSPP